MDRMLAPLCAGLFLLATGCGPTSEGAAGEAPQDVSCEGEDDRCVSSTSYKTCVLTDGVGAWRTHVCRSGDSCSVTDGTASCVGGSTCTTEGKTECTDAGELRTC